MTPASLVRLVRANNEMRDSMVFRQRISITAGLAAPACDWRL
jgi:hypothetical protein